MKSPFKKFIGIDPGKSGGVAVINGETAKVYACPRTVEDMSTLIGLCLNDVSANEIRIAVEKVWAFPTDGRRGSFSFGENYGQWQGILASHELKPTYVVPKKWQAHFEIEKGLKKVVRKRILKQIAIDKFPKTKGITLKTADAVLIAMYGLEEVLSYR